MAKEKVIVINFKDCWRELVILVLLFAVIVLVAVIIDNLSFEPIPVESYEAEFYDCVERCYADSYIIDYWGAGYIG